MIRWRCYMNTYHGWSLSTLPVDCDCCPVFRDCLESSRRVVDRLCVVLQEGEMGHFRPLLATRYTPNRGLLGLSRLSLEEEFCELRHDGVLRSSCRSLPQLSSSPQKSTN